MLKKCWITFKYLLLTKPQLKPYEIWNRTPKNIQEYITINGKKMFEKCHHHQSHADDLYYIYFQPKLKDIGSTYYSTGDGSVIYGVTGSRL